MKEWLIENADILSIRAIETRLINSHNMCRGTITKAISGTRNIPEHWEQPIKDVIIELQKTLPS